MNRISAAITMLATFFGLTGIQAQTPEGVPVITSKEDQTRIRKQSCALDRVEVREPMLAKDIFVDYRFLPVLLGNELDGVSDGWTIASDSHIIKYMLQAGWTALETQKGFETTTELPPKNSVLRFEVMPAGSASCKGWSTQYEHPLLVIPTLRALGLSPDQCIAISELPKPTAQGRIEVQRTRLYYDPGILASYTWRLDVQSGVVDEGARFNQAAYATLHLHQGDIGRHGNDKLWSACSGLSIPEVHSQGSTIAKSLEPEGVNKLHPRSTVDREEPGQPTYEPLSADRLEAYRWLKNRRDTAKLSAFYDIDIQGKIWTEKTPGRFTGWSISVVQTDRILRSPFPSDSHRNTYSTLAFAATPSEGYAVLVQVNRTGEIRLLEYDHQLQFGKAFTVTQEQLDEVLPHTL